MTLVYPTVHLLARPEVWPSALTVTRASAAARTNALGRVETLSADTLRHDFDPATGAYLGWLVEDARANQVLFSEALTQAPWLTDAASVAAGSVTAPDGVSVAGTLTEDTSNGLHTLRHDNLSFTTGQSYAFSVFARTNGRERLQLVLPSIAFGARQSAVFDLIGGGIGATEGTPAPTIEALADGWYRCAITATATVTTSSPVHLWLRDTGGVPDYAGDGTSGVHLWGAQVEAGDGPTSYIATTTAPVTRAADRLTMTLGEGVLNPVQGAILARGRVPAGLGATLADLSDGTPDSRLTLTLDAAAGTAGFTVINGGATVAALARAGVTGGSEARIAAGYARDDFALTLGGAAPATDATGTAPAVTTLTLGGTSAGASGPRCWIRQIGLFPRRLSDADLQRICV